MHSQRGFAASAADGRSIRPTAPPAIDASASKRRSGLFTLVRPGAPGHCGAVELAGRAIGRLQGTILAAIADAGPELVQHGGRRRSWRVGDEAFACIHTGGASRPMNRASRHALDHGIDRIDVDAGLNAVVGRTVQALAFIATLRPLNARQTRGVATEQALHETAERAGLRRRGAGRDHRRLRGGGRGRERGPGRLVVTPVERPWLAGGDGECEGERGTAEHAAEVSKVYARSIAIPSRVRPGAPPTSARSAPTWIWDRG